MGLDSIVNVAITTEATGVTQAGFGTPLVLSYHTVFPERLRYYTSTTDMIADGFSASSPEVKAVGAILSQNPRVTKVGVGRRDNAPTMKHRVTPVAGNDAVFTVTINGTAFSFAADADATVPEIVAGLVAAINAGAEPVTAASVGGAGTETALDLSADVAGALYTLELSATKGGKLLREDTTADAGIAADIAAVQVVDDDWYGLVLTAQGKAEIVAAAAAIETMRKILAVTSGDSSILDGVSTTDVASVLKAASYARTVLLYSPKPHEYGAAAWLGVMFPKDPGSASWKFKTLKGVSVATLTATEITALEAKHCNYYRTVAGVAITAQGYSPSGEFIDITHGVDWLQARMQERIFGRLVNVDKVPFTDGGIALVEQEIRAQLQAAVGVGLLAADPAPSVTVPKAAAVSANDKANRVLPDVRFAGTLAGAVHSLQISGTVSV